MIVIGVLKEKRKGRIEELIKKIFALSNLKCIIMEDFKINENILNDLKKSGIDCVIISLNKRKISSVYLDILILDNLEDVTNDLIKCLSNNTRLIYNSDVNEKCFVHPNAISYGMSYNADATISCIDDKYDGISFNYCLQKRLVSFDENIFSEGEFSIFFESREYEIDEILASVTCGLMCDTILLKELKVGIKK